MTTKNSDRVTSFARKARWHVVRIEGPIAWTALLDLKGLRNALDHKIRELENERTVHPSI